MVVLLRGVLSVPVLPIAFAAVWSADNADFKVPSAEIVVLSLSAAAAKRLSGAAREAATSCETILLTSSPEPMPGELTLDVTVVINLAPEDDHDSCLRLYQTTVRLCEITRNTQRNLAGNLLQDCSILRIND